jgi:NTP pyrophosphatase (non-canonical NTP hydrolase)
VDVGQLDILQEIVAERGRQDLKWGTQNHRPADWLAILGEEFGEVCRAVFEKDATNYREELLHVAAVAVSMMECLDRDPWKNKP